MGATHTEAEPLWTIDDLCRYLNVPRGRFYRWRNQGHGPPAFMVGRSLRFKPRDVFAWLEARAADREPVA